MDDRPADKSPNPQARQSANRQRNLRWNSILRFSPEKMLIALVLFIVSAPFVDEYRHGAIISTLCMTVVLITATFAMGGRRGTRIMALVLVIPALVVRWSAHLFPGLIPLEVFSIIGIAFVGFVVINIFRYILHSPEVGIEVLCAGISGYLLVGMLWAFAYTLVAGASPGAFSFVIRPGQPHDMRGFTAYYFSYITLCSVGYGDIVPVSPVARMLSMTEAMTGTFYVAVMIARLVALHSSRKQNT